MKVTFDPNRMRICYYNDLHGNSDYLSGMLYGINNFNNQEKDCVSFVLSGGDNCSGGDSKKNGFIFELMQKFMKVDVSAVGNHETDALSDGFYNAAKNKNIDFVATNVRFSEDNPMKDKIKKSVIKEQNGVKVGFVGTMPIDFKDCTKTDSQKGIEIDDFFESVEDIQEEVNKLKEQGIDKIIMVSHSGYEVDKEYAKRLDGVDVIIGGHTHTVVPNAKLNENVLMSKSGEPVLITQGGENADYYGIADLTFNDKGIIIKLSNQLYENQNKHKNILIEAIKDNELGRSPVVGYIARIDEAPKDRKTEPCAWTALIADAVKSEMNVDIALVNSANIRKVPQIGKLTERDITESTPMNNKLIKTKITEKQLVTAIEHMAKETLSTGRPGLMQGSGFTYIISDQGELLEMTINNKPINIKNPSDKIYTACYDSYVAKEDGDTPELFPQFPTTYFDYDKDKCTIDYLRKRKDKKNLKIDYDNRIQILKKHTTPRFLGLTLSHKS